jgi:hypothetical protein
MIRLVRKRGVILLDEADMPKTGSLKVTPHGYAVWTVYTGHDESGRETRSEKYLHRVILAAPEGFEVDHIDGNRLNNTRANLRVVPHKANMRNMLGKKRGVYAEGARFRSAITVDYRQIHLGTYDTREEAHAAYAAAKKRYHPEIGDRV